MKKLLARRGGLDLSNPISWVIALVVLVVCILIVFKVLDRL